MNHSPNLTDYGMMYDAAENKTIRWTDYTTDQIWHLAMDAQNNGDTALERRARAALDRSRRSRRR
jgi:hypothetical protein